MAWILEHLFGFLLEILAAITGAWIFSAWYPAISDYKARLSVRATHKKIANLERILYEYESDFENPNLFVGRLIRLALVVVISVGFQCFWILFWLGIIIYVKLSCEIKKINFEQFPVQGVSDLFGSPQGITLVFIYIIGVASLTLFFVGLARFELQRSPRKFRGNLTARINGLRARLTTQ
jgi:hypothetical protein